MSNRIQKDAQFWDRAARKYANDPIEDMAGYENTLKAVSERLNQNDTVIELGCGTGTSAMRLASHTKHYLATDISTEMIEIAKEKLTASPISNLSFEVGEPVSTHWPDAAYDAVLAFNVLHLVASMPDTLQAVHQLLKPGGVFISKTPCLKMMNPLIRLAIPIMQMIGKAPSVKTLQPDEIEQNLTNAGFQIIEYAWHGEKGKDTRPYFVAQKT